MTPFNLKEALQYPTRVVNRHFAALRFEHFPDSKRVVVEFHHALIVADENGFDENGDQVLFMCEMETTQRWVRILKYSHPMDKSLVNYRAVIRDQKDHPDFFFGRPWIGPVEPYKVYK